jgi:seryl-tRNA synthetase
MLDIGLFRNSPDVVRADLKKRGMPAGIVDDIVKLDRQWRDEGAALDEARRKKNGLTRAIAKATPAERKKLLEDVKKVDRQIAENGKTVEAAKQKRDSLLMRVPNLLKPDVPKGKDSSENVPVRTWGKPGKKNVKPHGELAEALGIADFDRAAKTSGRGFVFLRGGLAQLELALQRFAIDSLLAKGFELVQPPLAIGRKPYEGVTDLADFENVMYKIDGHDLYLIATSEHPLAAMFMDDVLPEESLPLRLAGVSACFRKEIGAHGVDTKGLFRMHQFNKVEQFVFCRPEESEKIHEELIANSEELWKKLEIPYRVVNICTGDIGTVAAKKYDIEAWSPRQEKYAEVVSGSNCTDYQARRLNIKFGKRGGETKLVHTLNCTAIATSRAMVAILENYQENDGTVRVPKALQPYMNGLKAIGGNSAAAKGL